jgi:beta-N-acetylhexosaminidase
VSRLREDQLGQLFLVRLGDCRWNEALGRKLRIWSPAGVVLPDVLPRSPESTCELLHRIARVLPVAPFLVVREEGGAYDPLSRFLPPLPPPGAAAARGLPAVTRLGDLIGEALVLLGFNTNFAPRLDLSVRVIEERHGSQTFGSDAHFVAECGRAFVRGLERHHVLACGKHFPGLASVAVHPRGKRATNAKPMAALWREDLVPFRELLPKLSMVLISAACYKAYDFDQLRPAFQSRAVVTSLLRAKLGYHGLAVAYDFESAPDVGEAVAQSLDAGCDLFVVDEGESVERAEQGVKAGLESRKLLPDRVEQALHRIRVAKRRLRQPVSRRVAPSAWERLVRRYESFSKEFAPADRGNGE